MKFTKETDLCSAFREVAESEGWDVYPEQCDWDLLLVRRGIFVGVEAKLQASMKVLSQALPANLREKNPHYRCVLVPKASSDFYRVANASRILVLTPRIKKWLLWDPRGKFGNKGRVNSYTGHGIRRVLRRYRWEPPVKSMWLPPFIPNLPAGVSSPRTVSRFKVQACRLQKLYEDRGWVTIQDARDLGYGYGLLGRFYQASAEYVEGSRKKKWKPILWIKPASVEFPEVWEQLNPLP